MHEAVVRYAEQTGEATGRLQIQHLDHCRVGRTQGVGQARLGHCRRLGVRRILLCHALQYPHSMTF